VGWHSHCQALATVSSLHSTAWLSSTSQETAIRAACEAAAVEVTDAVGSALLDADSADASMSLNTVAARAWRGYELTIASELSREQEERIAALLATTRH
jgi:hypothetical protein